MTPRDAAAGVSLLAALMLAEAYPLAALGAAVAFAILIPKEAR